VPTKNSKMTYFEYNFSSHPFVSPGYLLCNVPDCVRIELLNTIDSTNKKEDNCTGTLAGHVDQEYYLPIGENIKYLVESMSSEYDKIYFNGRSPFLNNFSYCAKDKTTMKVNYSLTSLWINYSKKYDFNPIHNHNGIYSFVIWVKIPYELNEEKKVYDSVKNQTSLFNFHYTDFLGNVTTLSLDIDETWEWKMAFFPSKLSHSVNPFYTSDEYRISISGNVSIGTFEYV
jgi:hypothetical protein